ncbi:prepilin peptidase [Microlunatus capsulatus]|uniref:Leader peptidase (Prepilin peptidase)/N-methyltransferase n=1 Tax=Microlunatus capsulatus TaxID=99117 RepID=A0ABS4ZC84_9ACTN|nr:prepilin peptidase [Microlunatus capsulatus]MBP2418332.1 leader peptidase (prepilin peptidase)/N-methyltransferase [Microlunatus capsulatus]
MTPAQLLVCTVVLVTGLGTALATGPLLRWLPEPADPDPPGYARLPTPRFVLGVGLTSGLAAAVAWTALPLPVQPLWTVLATGGVLLAAVDLATTWLPLRLVHITWAAMAVAALAGASLGGSWEQLGRSAVGAAVAGGLYLGVWTVSRGGFGFGDVRYAPLLGAAAAAVGWPLLLLALLAGTLVGGVVGVVRLVRRRGGSFAYAPSMLVGAYLAALSRWPG